MSVRMRHTRGQTGSRRSHHALKQRAVVVDKETGALSLPHRLDEKTGMYRGKQIIAPKAKKVKASKVKGPDTEPHDETHAHEHAHVEHKNAEVKGSRGILGKLTAGGRPKARSGAGGGGV